MLKTLLGTRKALILGCLIGAINYLYGQASTPAPQSVQPETVPVMSQIKESVVFIQTDCQHIPTSPDDKAVIDSFVGTGFLVFYQDTRLGQQGGFSYLITNGHVALPGIEQDKPCAVMNYSLSLNLKPTDVTHPSHSQIAPLGKNPGWRFPKDDSIDLAILPIGLDLNIYEYKTLSTKIFATNEVMKDQAVVEGDRIFFTGLFIQYMPFLNQSRLEPIVRGGSLALIPNEKIPTVLHGLAGTVYLGEAHAFGGNSGSPVFVDVGGMREHGTATALDYRFLGVVSGEVFETENLQLEVTTPTKGSAKANSGLSVIVPAQQVLDFLNSDSFQTDRDKAVAKFNQKH